MSAYKVVGKFKKKEDQKNWCKGREGTQAKKRVYINDADYMKYSPNLIERWARLYDVEIYKNNGGNWILIK